MKISTFALIPLTAIVVLAAGCATTLSPHAEFVKTVNFSPFQAFEYRHTMVSTFDLSNSERMVLEELSEAVVTRELEAKGFQGETTGGDFYVVTKWRKALSSAPRYFPTINGPLEAAREQDRGRREAVARYSLDVELYETETDDLFWRSQLPYVFDAIEFSEERVVTSLKHALRNFPSRIHHDPNLPSIQ